MSQKHSTTKKPFRSKWIDSQGRVTNPIEFAKEKGWISEDRFMGKKVKMYLPEALQDPGGHPWAEAFYTYDIPLMEENTAILIDQYGKCWLRMVRIEDGQLIVISPLWPHGEVTFPLDYFTSIEPVIRISLEKGPHGPLSVIPDLAFGGLSKS